MGCCDSLSQGQQTQIINNPLYNPNVHKIATIEPYYPLTPDLPSDCNSMFTLDLKLDHLIKNYEGDNHQISSYRVESMRKKSSSSQKYEKEQEEISNKESSMCDMSASSSALTLVHKTQLLTNRSILEDGCLEKRLFYINSSQYGKIKLKFWDQINRTPLIFTKQNILQFTGTCKQYQFMIAILSIYFYQSGKDIKLISYKKQCNGMRIFFNGTKRLLTFPYQSSLPNIFTHLAQLLPHFVNRISTSFIIYMLTGWIPEIVDMSQIQDKKEILSRLTANFKNSTLLISFTGSSLSLNKEALILKSTEIDSDELKFIVVGQNMESLDEEVSKSWSQIVEHYPILSINWNPTLYGFCQNIEFQIKKSADLQKTFLLIRIPANKNDSEIRVVAERHINSLQIQLSNFQLNLYDHNAWSTKIQGSALRQGKSANFKYLSDTLIFQCSEEESLYELVLETNEVSEDEENNQFTVSFYSFISLSIRNITESKKPYSFFLSGHISPQNAGFGINSPYFTHNLHYCLEVPTKYKCKIEVQTKQHCEIELALIPDENVMKDISFIRVQKLATSIIQSETENNKNIIQFQSQYQNYILVIICFQVVEMDFQISVFGENLFIDRKFQNNPINLSELKFQPDFILQKAFQWKEEYSGPRKRLQENSEDIFYPMNVFENFLCNPVYQHPFQSGYYQFSITSLTFLEEVMKGLKTTDDSQLFMEIVTPPSLSLNILKKKDDKLKIIVDDAFYVPFGMGFWSQPIYLQDAVYVIVMPKIERTSAQGLLRVRRLQR